MKWGKYFIGSIMTALLLTMAFPLLGWGMLVWVALIPILPITREKGWHRFLLGWLTGTLIQAFGYGWIFYTIRDFGGLSSGLSAGGALLFWLYQGLDMGIWLGIGPRLFRGWPFLFRALGLAGFWLLIQGYWFPYIFPANYGAALAGMPLFGAGAALWSGKGMTFWVVAAQTIIILPEGPRMRNRIWWAAVVFLMPLLGLAITRVSETDTFRIGVVQPNIIPWAKRGGQTAREIFAAHEKPTRSWLNADLDLLVWPETAVPFDLRQAETYKQRLRELAQDLGAPIVTGAVGIFGSNRYTNEVWFFPPNQQEPSVYQKERLVLFSEKLPWILSWATYFDQALGGFMPGKNNKPFEYQGRSMVPLICFEALFPASVRHHQGHLMLNLTNDAWFGQSKASALHLQHIRHRSVETGVPLIRATNSGISCWIDAKGEIHEPTPLYQSAAVIFEVPIPKQLPLRLDDWGERLILLFSFFAMGVSLTKLLWPDLGVRSQA